MKHEDEIVGSLFRRARHLTLVYRVVQVAFLVNGAVFVFSASYALLVNVRDPQHANPVIVVAGLVSTCLFWLLYFAMEWFASWVNTNMAKRLQRVIDTLYGLKKLRAEHPELLLLNDVTELLEDEKAQINSRRSFWVNIVVNLVFTLLGFALSYTATTLGWLR